jgi:hypothetical protein
MCLIQPAVDNCMHFEAKKKVTQAVFNQFLTDFLNSFDVNNLGYDTLPPPPQPKSCQGPAKPSQGQNYFAFYFAFFETFVPDKATCKGRYISMGSHRSFSKAFVLDEQQQVLSLLLASVRSPGSKAFVLDEQDLLVFAHNPMGI